MLSPNEIIGVKINADSIEKLVEKYLPKIDTKGKTSLDIINEIKEALLQYSKLPNSIPVLSHALVETVHKIFKNNDQIDKQDTLRLLAVRAFAEIMAEQYGVQLDLISNTLLKIVDRLPDNPYGVRDALQVCINNLEAVDYVRLNTGLATAVYEMNPFFSGSYDARFSRQEVQELVEKAYQKGLTDAYENHAQHKSDMAANLIQRMKNIDID